MRWIFWGTLWELLGLTLDFNGTVFRILPVCVCYFLIMTGCTRMMEESASFRTCRTVYGAMALGMLVIEGNALLGQPLELLSVCVSIAALFGRYLLVRGVQGMEGRYGDLGGTQLLTAWRVWLVCALLLYPLQWVGENVLVLVGIAMAIGALCAAIWFTWLLHRAWKTYETRYEQVYAMDNAWNQESERL